MVAVMILHQLYICIVVSTAANLITVPLFKESCVNGIEKNSGSVAERALSEKRPVAVQFFCANLYMNYGIIKIGSDQLSAHGNGPVNIDGSRDFKVVFDTGSVALWVFENRNAPLEAYKQSYYKSANLTANPTEFEFTAAYGTATATKGIYYMDKVCINNLCAVSQFLGIVSTYKSCRISRFEGVFGLGNFKDPSVPKKNIDKIEESSYSVLEHILMANKLPEIFALWLNRTSGILSLGGPDMQHYHDPITYSPVISNQLQYWQIEGSHLLINNKMFAMPRVILDSGNGLINGPREVIGAIWKMLQVDKMGNFKCARIPTFPNIVVELPNYRVILSPEDYVMKGSIPTHEFHHPKARACHDYIVKYYDNDLWNCGFRKADNWTLGEQFLQKVYTIFDAGKQRVGFAKPKVL